MRIWIFLLKILGVSLTIIAKKRILAYSIDKNITNRSENFE